MFNEDLRRSIPGSLEIISEAVKNLSNGFKGEQPGIPWSTIAGLRDSVIHASCLKQKNSSNISMKFFFKARNWYENIR